MHLFGSLYDALLSYKGSYKASCIYSNLYTMHLLSYKGSYKASCIYSDLYTMHYYHTKALIKPRASIRIFIRCITIIQALIKSDASIRILVTMHYYHMQVHLYNKTKSKSAYKSTIIIYTSNI